MIGNFLSVVGSNFLSEMITGFLLLQLSRWHAIRGGSGGAELMGDGDVVRFHTLNLPMNERTTVHISS